jgi:hypothetical protein
MSSDLGRSGVLSHVSFYDSVLRKTMAPLRLNALFMVSSATAFVFNSSSATDLQPLFNVAAPWLGADIATSVCFSNQSSCVWLHGDTLVGNMQDGVRHPTSMPRNSIALLNTSSGNPTSRDTHFIRSHAGNPQHWGFFSPPNTTEWYWPMAGVQLDGDLYVIASRMGPGSGGLFNFVTLGVDVLYVPRPSLADPLSWPAPVITSLVGQNNTFNIGHAATVSPDGFVYFLGSFGPNGQTAMLARISVNDFRSFRWDAVAYWAVGDVWVGLTTALAPSPLFDGVPSETTLYFHETLSAW